MNTYALKRINKLIGQKEPAILLIGGKWGGGKTYAFWQALKQYAPFGKKSKYSYISLIGVANMDELGIKLFENTNSVKSLDDVDTGDFTKAALVWLNSHWRWLSTKLLQAPFVSKFIGEFYVRNLSDSGVKGNIVCIDDIERRQASLTVLEILRYAAELRDNKRCKVVLIYNDHDEKDGGIPWSKNEFEKLVDQHVSFDPTPEQCFKIAIQSYDVFTATEVNLLKMALVRAGIANIRVVIRIIELAEQVVVYKSGISERVLRRIFKHIVEKCAIKYMPAEHNQMFNIGKTVKRRINARVVNNLKAAGVGETGRISDNNHELYELFTFSPVDADPELMSNLSFYIEKSVEGGYFSSDAIKEILKEEEAKESNSEARASFDQAWDMFNSGFGEDSVEFLNLISEAFKGSCYAITAQELSLTVEVLTNMNRADLAERIIVDYVNNSSMTLETMDARVLGNNLVRKEVRTAFEKRFRSLVSQDTGYLLKLVSDKKPIFLANLDIIANIGQAKLEEIFLTLSGDKLRQAIYNCLSLENIDGMIVRDFDGVSGKMHDTERQTHETLMKLFIETSLVLQNIAQDSLNCERLRAMGIEFKDSQLALAVD